MNFGIPPPNYRLPSATSVGRVRLQVSNLARSVGYYRHILGMTVLSETATTAELGSVGGERVLVELHERAGVRAVPRRGTVGLYHFALLLPDRPALGRFLSHLATTGVHVGMADHLVSEALYLSDPDGLGIEVYRDRPKDTWTVGPHRQLDMASDPLDTDSIIAEAGDEPWTGQPAGTVMGHVHLHVGDLTTAEAFYHRALGFDKTAWTYPGALFMSAGGYHHHLGTNTWSSGAPAADDQARLLSWDLHVPTAADAKAAAGNLIASGYGAVASGSSWEASDPWGTVLRIVPAA